ncbi:hypothetical protein CDAR_92031 [Caerostris darwini]|uniref:Uncharacterized protein n=1 Tax=Caerostris darwini TaxID=1538125 RepID=A0AAV4QN30_9ARAC|nr:hypothetical protein CDAR_92031 [Caerostris darwini]
MSKTSYRTTSYRNRVRIRVPIHPVQKSILSVTSECCFYMRSMAAFDLLPLRELPITTSGISVIAIIIKKEERFNHSHATFTEVNPSQNNTTVLINGNLLNSTQLHRVLIV